MKRSLISAAFVAAATGAVGVSANNTDQMKGSDTLFDFTTSIFAACPGVVGAYVGTGSGNGQTAMINGVQQVAPMSRFLNSGACSGAVVPDAGPGVRTPSSLEQGLVVALDSIDIVGSTKTLGSFACNLDDNVNCDTLFEPNSGAAYDTTISTSAGSYTFNGWRDVLRVLLAGFSNTNVGTGAANWAARSCNSPERIALANGYGTFFENNCAAASGDTSADPNFAPVCKEIRHVFRRDDFSGTTDTVTTLLGIPSIVNPTSTAQTGADPFCNAVRPAFVYPAPAPTCLQGSDQTFDATSINIGSGFCNPACAAGQICQNSVCIGTTNCSPACGGTTPFCNAGTCVGLQQTTNCTPACSGMTPFCYGGSGGGGGTCSAGAPLCAAGSCCRESAVYRSTMQDNDPIRRTCAGSGASATAPAEDNCSHSGDLGLVLSMNDVQEAPPHTNADRYNATPCVLGKFASVSAPDVYDAVAQTKAICTRGLLCPNGDRCNNFGGCLAPADASGNPQCLASKRTTPALTTSSLQVPQAEPKLPSLNDGRSYNQHLYLFVAPAGAYQVGNSVTQYPVTGAFYRIHTNHILAPAADAGPPATTCQQTDMTNQIGCLVAASPCSLGYAGRGTLAANPQNSIAPVKLNRINPDLLCVQGHFLYPFARKLYLNSVPGFDAVTGQELQLAGCETDLAQPSLGTPAGIVTNAVASAGFIPIPSFVNQGEPFCEDFNERMLCNTAGANNDTCVNNIPSNIDNFPQFETVCGDGQLDSFEDCDNGTLNGPPPATCSTTCRFNN